MTRAAFSLEIFGDRIPLTDFYSSGDNNRQVERMKKALLKAIDTELTDRQKQIVIEYYFNGLSVTKIAEIYDVSKSTVSRHLSRARERLKTSLKYGIYTFL
ncbi:MAG: sigma-70 family RNA polymerase sigma factor [Clostridia bacterium]|nr:sigma-70 family RNA polymerase sigma factor [Clostridia bacterium]